MPLILAMPPNVNGGLNDSLIAAQADRGAATFHRPVTLPLPYSLTTRSAPWQPRLDDASPESLAHAVARLCEAEVSKMRAILGELGVGLSSRLSKNGLQPIVDQHFEDQDERIWDDRQTTLLVQPSRTETTIPERIRRCG